MNMHNFARIIFTKPTSLPLTNIIINRNISVDHFITVYISTFNHSQLVINSTINMAPAYYAHICTLQTGFTTTPPKSQPPSIRAQFLIIIPHLATPHHDFLPFHVFVPSLLFIYSRATVATVPLGSASPLPRPKLLVQINTAMCSNLL